VGSWRNRSEERPQLGLAGAALYLPVGLWGLVPGSDSSNCLPTLPFLEIRKSPSHGLGQFGFVGYPTDSRASRRRNICVRITESYLSIARPGCRAFVFRMRNAPSGGTTGTARGSQNATGASGVVTTLLIAISSSRSLCKVLRCGAAPLISRAITGAEFAALWIMYSE
jgi:hypothetical protein